MKSLSFSSHPPHSISNVIHHQQCAVSRNPYTDRSAHRFACWRDEAGQYVDWDSRWASACKWYEYHPVTAERFSVPGSMLSNKHPVAKAFGHARAPGRGESRRGGVGAERVVGLQPTADEVEP